MGITQTALWRAADGLPEGTELSPNLRSWWHYLGEEGRELVSTALDRRREVVGAMPPAEFLESVLDATRRFEGSPSAPVTLTDFSGRRAQTLRNLRRALGEVEKRDLGLADRRYGAVSHMVIPLLLEGKLPAHHAGERTRSNESDQILLFEVGNLQAELEIREFNPAQSWPSLEGVSRLCNIPDIVINDIERMVVRMREKLSGARDGFARCALSLSECNFLSSALRPIVGGFVDKLPRYEDVWTDHLRTLTLLTWAYTIVYAARTRSERVLFKEVPAIDRRYGLSGGRIDALEVIRMDGQPLSRKERSIVGELSNRRFGSVAGLVESLRRCFGKEVELVLYDWKCGVGDFPDKGDLVSPDDCPQPSQIGQMQRYLALDPVDWFLHERSRGDIWAPEYAHVSAAHLAFFLPTHDHFEHVVRLTGDERREVFQSRFVSAWCKAEHRSRNRVLTNEIVRVFTKGGDPQSVRSHARVGSHNVSAQLFEDRRDMRAIIDSHRTYVDRHRIVERIRSRGRDLHLLHFDVLTAAVRKGRVKVAHFDRTGGRISCLHPEHKDKNPAMDVSVERRSFHCYACGFGGIIAAESLGNEHIEIRLTADPKVSEVVIPDECDRIISKLTLNLSLCFNGSPAEEYLARERKLDPRRAWEHGAGYGSPEAIALLCAHDKYSLDTLAEYGVITYSPNVTADSPLVRALQDLGMSLRRIKRVQEREVNGQIRKVTCLPYSVLLGRVTFPLLLEGRYTNIYGRAIKGCDKRHKHRKLKVRPGGIAVKQGGFNMSVLAKGLEEVIITEAPIDALTLIEMGHPNTVAMMGTGNWYVLSSILEKARAVRLAFNADEAGFKATGRIVRYAWESGFVDPDWNNISDLSREFFPGKNATDFNAWWTSRTP